MGNRRFLDNLQWKVKMLKGADKVRRRISPQTLYGNTAPEKMPFQAIITLVKSNKKNLELRSVSAHEAAAYNTLIIENEYSNWNNILRWVEINNRYMSQERGVHNVSDRMSKMSSQLTKTFEQGKCYILEIPLDIEHNEFKEKAKNLILDELNKV